MISVRVFRRKLFLLWVFPAAAAAVSLGEFLINWLYFHEPCEFPIRPTALCANILILGCFMILVLVLLNRLMPAILTGVAIYSLLLACNILKLLHFDAPLRPADFYYLADLQVVAGALFQTRILIGAVILCASILVIGIIGWRRALPALSGRSRILIGALVAVLAWAILALPASDTVRDWLFEHGIESPDFWVYEPRVSARLNGLLVEVALSAGEASFRQPEKYSRSEVDRIIHDHPLPPDPITVSKKGPPINLIIYLVESLMDPSDLGVRFTEDPIPTFHALSRQGSHGRIVVPVFGGGSANTEFEILTGLSMYFLPDWSSAYRQYISQDIPSLPRFLSQHGYHTTGVLSDPPYLFNRSLVYSHLGFENWQFPGQDPKAPRSPDPEWVADGVIADAVIAASKKSSPYFIFAFPGGTHYPWDYPDYLKSGLEPTKRFPEPHWSYLKTYANALRVADASLNKLITYYAQSDQKTAILVMGDHLPAFPGPDGIYEITGFFKADDLEQTRRRYQVPVALWCNWPAEKENLLFSANYLAAWLVNFLGMRSDATLAFSADVHGKFPVLSKYVQTEGGSFFPPHAQDIPYQSLLDDYLLLQYDLLLGNQYALDHAGWQLSAPRRK